MRINKVFIEDSLNYALPFITSKNPKAYKGQLRRWVVRYIPELDATVLEYVVKKTHSFKLTLDVVNAGKYWDLALSSYRAGSPEENKARCEKIVKQFKVDYPKSVIKYQEDSYESRIYYDAPKAVPEAVFFHKTKTLIVNSSSNYDVYGQSISYMSEFRGENLYKKINSLKSQIKYDKLLMFPFMLLLSFASPLTRGLELKISSIKDIRDYKLLGFIEILDQREEELFKGVYDNIVALRSDPSRSSVENVLFQGASLFKIKNRHLLMDVDRKEISHPEGSLFNLFLSEVPFTEEQDKTIEQAYLNLRPDISTTLHDRQGEWFFFELSEVERENLRILHKKIEDLENRQLHYKYLTTLTLDADSYSNFQYLKAYVFNPSNNGEFREMYNWNTWDTGEVLHLHTYGVSIRNLFSHIKLLFSPKEAYDFVVAVCSLTGRSTQEKEKRDCFDFTRADSVIGDYKLDECIGTHRFGRLYRDEKGNMYASGKVVHTGNSHHPVDLGNTWYRLVKNTSNGSWNVTGYVD